MQRCRYSPPPSRLPSATQRACSRRASVVAPNRDGFSLIELMIVIVVIGILVAVLLPAVNRVRRTTQNTAVSVDIKSLEKAIADFKLKFGVEPPSSIILYEGTPATMANCNWTNDTQSTGVANQVERDARRNASLAIIRSIWPNYDYTLNCDINGDGDRTDFVILNGSECLAFFLGGVCATNIVDQTEALVGTAGGAVTSWAPLGFSTNPARPFIRGGTRIQPFYDFTADRLVNTFDHLAVKQYMPELLDTLPGQTVPYLYASSYSGRGYNSVNASVGSPNPDLQIGPTNRITGTATYLQTYRLGGPGIRPALNAKTYQIISPGFDNEYGTGGEFDSTNAASSLSGRPAERDNITNFNPGPLQP